MATLRLKIKACLMLLASSVLACAFANSTETLEYRVAKGDTLLDLLLEAGSSAGDAARAMEALGDVHDPRTLQIGETVTAGFRHGSDGTRELAEVIIALDEGHHVVTSRANDDSFFAVRIEGPLDAALTAPVAAPPGSVSESGFFSRNLEVRRGDTLMRLAVRAGATGTQADAAIRALGRLVDPRSLQIGQTLQVVFSEDGPEPVLEALGLAVEEGHHAIAERREGDVWTARRSDTPFASGEQPATAGEVDLAEALERLESASFRVIPLTVASGDTLTNLMVDGGTTISEAIESARAIGNHYDPRRLRAGQHLHLVFIPGPAGSDLRVLGLVVLQAEDEGFILAIRRPDGEGFGGQRIFSTATVMAAAEALAGPEAAAIAGETGVDEEEAATEFAADLASELLVVEPGDTLISMLVGAGADRVDADRAIRALMDHFNPRGLQPGQEVRAIFDLEGGKARLVTVGVNLGNDRYARADFTGSEFVAEITDTLYWPVFAAVIDEAEPESEAEESAETKRYRGIIVSAATDEVDADAGRTAASGTRRVRGAISHEAGTAEVEAPAEPETEVAAPVAEPDLLTRRAFVVDAGEILMTGLLEAEVDRVQAHGAVMALSEVFDPRRTRAGQSVEVAFDAEGLYELAITPKPGERIIVRRGDDGGYVAERSELPLELQHIAATGRITSSLYEAALDSGVPIKVLQRMILSYSFDVDFQREIRSGDSFEVLYERFVDESGEVVRYGLPLYMSLHVSGATLSVYRFIPESGFADYFNDKGESVRKALLRTPVDGARITSGFGKRTLFGYTRMHKGVDFGVPTGAPIMAAGDGVIESIGVNGNYGNYIRIRHNSTYKTAYAHMSRFASGLTGGSRVRQGETIGFVGSTGRSTGPHLHYEVLVNNQQINPLDIRLPAGEILTGDELERFYVVRDQLDALFNLHLVRQVSSR